MVGFVFVGGICGFLGFFIALTCALIGLGPWALLICPGMAIVGGILGFIIEIGLMNNG